LAAKNAVVLKPSAMAPLSALKMAEIIDSYLPDGAINTVTGRGTLLVMKLSLVKKWTKFHSLAV